jgi:hypothetical protein
MLGTPAGHRYGTERKPSKRRPKEHAMASARMSALKGVLGKQSHHAVVRVRAHRERFDLELAVTWIYE